MITDGMNTDEISRLLTTFNEKNCLPIAKLSLTTEEQKKFWTQLEKLLSSPDHVQCHRLVLNSLRILSRNKDVVNSVLTKDTMDLLLGKAGLAAEGQLSARADVDDDQAKKTEGSDIWETVLEASKCISNIYFQCSRAIGLCADNQSVARIFAAMEHYVQYKVTRDVIEFDLKILFLITAHSQEARHQARYVYQGIGKLIRLVRQVAERSRCGGSSIPAEGQEGPSSSTNSQTTSTVLDGKDAAVISVAFKVIFNLTSDLNTSVPSEDDKLEVDQESFAEYQDLSDVSRLVLTVDAHDEEAKQLVVRNVINILTTFPIKAMEGLVKPLDRDFIGDADEREVKHEGVVVNAPKVVLEYLIDLLSQPSSPRNGCSFRDNLTPVLKASCMIAAGYPAVRKYFRSRVLPPITDVSKRPEDGECPKGRLCSLLTSPDSSVSVMVAEFIFILCKQNVKRMVKHTGYGNAAGLLARKGLMGGGISRDQTGNFSSTDSDSDTEEYTSNRHKVNPITGYVEPPRPKPFEGMSEEQKEYEAVKLANLIDKLHNMGVVKPAKMGEDGKPHPVEHVLELCESQAQQQMGFIEDNSDSE